MIIQLGQNSSNKPEDWIYSSASNYLGVESILEIHTLHARPQTYQ